MSKITLTPIANLQNETTAVAAISANNTTLTTAMDNTLSRDGTSPNQMSASLDMNSQRIINLAAPVANSDAARFSDIGTAVSSSVAAAASATAAAASATTAAGSVVTAAGSVTSAATQATNAATSATAAATSATAAASSATAAASSATSSATSATASATSAASAANAVGGNLYQFDTSTAMGLPATGFMRANNATLSSATNLVFNASTADTGNPNLDAYLAVWAASTNTVKGYIEIRRISAPANFRVYSISAVTDNTTWVQVAVTHIAGNGTFSASDILSVQFSRAGDKGADGSGVSGGANHQVALFSNTGVISGGTGVGTSGQLLIGQGATLDPSFNSVAGDVTITNTGATTLGNIPTATTAAGSIVQTNIVAPASPAAGKVSIYADSTDLRFHDKNASGSIGTTVVADPGASNNFLTAIGVTGVISKAQPAFTNISGTATIAQGGTGSVDIGSASGNLTGYTTTVTAAGTTTLTSASNRYQYFTGTTTQTVVLPAVSTLALGSEYWIVNNSTGLVTVQSSGANTIMLLPQRAAVRFIANAVSGTGTSVWNTYGPFENIPQNSQSGAYTTKLGDANCHILHPTADNTARTFTIDSNANVPYPIGTTLMFVNQINTVTIQITSDTLTMAGSGLTGNRTLAPAGIATALKITSTGWIISGSGLT